MYKAFNRNMTYAIYEIRAFPKNDLAGKIENSKSCK